MMQNYLTTFEVKFMNSKQDKSLNHSLKLLPIGAYAMEHDYLKRLVLTILEGAFVFQGYEPIRDKDYDKNYQLFPDQESFIKHVKEAISTGCLRAHKQKIDYKEVLVINTYDFFKWTIENVDVNRFPPYLKSIWIELSAKKEFDERKPVNKRSYRPKHEIIYRDTVVEAAREIRQQDNDIPIYLMIEHIQEEYSHLEKKEMSADTLKGWIIDAGIGPGITTKLRQSEEKIFRNKEYIF